MSFLDYILAGFGIYEKKNKNSLQSNITFRKNYEEPHFKKPEQYKNKLAIFCPKNLEEIIEVAEFLSTNQPVMLNVSMLNDNIVQRGMDFLFGATTATKTTTTCIGKGLYIFTPKDTKILNRIKDYD